ncbi:MAG: class I SAM-dependent methyltransferase [Lacipirellulaceae bacterium]
MGTTSLVERIGRAARSLLLGDATATSAASAEGEVLASCGQLQNQAQLNGIRPLPGFQNVYSSPAELRMPERVALYSLVFGLQPTNCLEIGTFRGGSTSIICGALDDTGRGKLSCVDPTPLVAPELWRRLEHRCTMFQGCSPEVLRKVAGVVKDRFDFVFIDGNHTYECLSADIRGVTPYLADRAVVVFHDAHYDGVRRAIDEAVSGASEFIDFGLVSVEPTVLREGDGTVSYAGLRMLRFARDNAMRAAA